MSRPAPAASHSALTIDAGRFVRDARQSIGWTQRELAERARVTQTAISRLELGGRSGLGLDEVSRITIALGGRARLVFEAPYLADRSRQRDRVHARCVAYVSSCLRRRGWVVDSEVEIDGRSGPGWIDVLAFHASSGTLLVVEIKTEIHDFGRVQRTLAWYERRAWAVARGRGWRVRRAHGALLLLATDAVDARLRENRHLADEAFPGRAEDLLALSTDPSPATTVARSLAMIDPLSRRHDWLRKTRLDGRRSRAPHEDYASVVRRLGRG